MSSGGDLDLTKFINPNLTWKTVKKGSRGLRKQAARKIKVGAELGSNVSKDERDSSACETKKIGEAVLGEHSAEKRTGIPPKKRIIFLPPPKTPSLNQEGSLLPHHNNSSSDQEEQLVISICASGQPSSNSCAEKCVNSLENRLGMDGCVISKSSVATTKEFFGTKNLSSIESSKAKKHATTQTNDLLTAGLKGTVTTSSESGDSSVPRNAFPVVKSLHYGNEHENGEKSSPPLKKAKFHWDLNKTMDEWEEPCFNLPQSCVVDDGVHCENPKLEDCRRNEFDNTGCERKHVASDTEISLNKSTMIDFFVPHASSSFSLVGQDDVIGDSRQKEDQGYSDTTTNDFSKAADSKKHVDMFHEKLLIEEADRGGLQFQKSCKSLDNDKYASENPQSDVCGSEVFQDKQRHLVDGNNMTRVQEGYESPYEDGELRETVVNAWDEKEAEKKENERIDFKSNNEYKVDNDTRPNSLSKKFVPGHGDSQTTQETSLLVEKNIDTVPVNLITSGVHQSQELRNYADLEGKETGPKNGYDETRISGGNMFPVKGSLSFNGLRRSETADMKRSRWDDVGAKYFRTERDFGSEEVRGRVRLPFQGHGRNEVDFRWADSGERIWEWRNRYLDPRPRNVIGDSDGRSSGFNGHDQSQSRSYDPKGERRTMRGFSRERSRGRSVFSPEVYRRGPEEKYHERGSYYLERKERGFTPSFGRDSQFVRSHRRSQSRSRSLSPMAWNMHKRSMTRGGTDYRSEGRVQGERFSSQKSINSGDFERRFVSPPPRSRRGSPQRNSRCFDDRKYIDRHYRVRRSSTPFRPNPRFDYHGPAERSKSSGDYFRSGTRPGRLSQMPGFGPGPRSYDGSSDDGKKPDERNETINKMRRGDIGAGGMGIFGHDAENSIELRDARDMDGFVSKRTTPSSIKEERISPRIDQEKVTDTDAIPGEQDFDVKLTDTDAIPGEHDFDVKLTDTDAIPGEQDFDVKLTDTDAIPGEQDFDVNLTNTDTSLGKQDFDVKLTNTGASLGEEDFDVKLTNTGASLGEEDFDVKLTNTDAVPGEQDFDVKLTNIDVSPGKHDFNLKLTNTDVSLGKQDFDMKLTNTDVSIKPQDFDVKLTNTEVSSPGKQDVYANALTKED